MFRKYPFIFLLVFVIAPGCNMLDSNRSPNVTTPPPYWQTPSRLAHGQLAESQLSEIRAFHEKETAAISEEMHVFRNREVERLSASGKELSDKLSEKGGEMNAGQPSTSKQNPQQQEHAASGPTKNEKWSLTGWFKKKDKDNAPEVSEAGVSVR